MQNLLIQGGGEVCASLDMSGGGAKTVECSEPCTADAGSISGEFGPHCLVEGSATLTATPAGDSEVPAGYTTLYVLTRTNALIIEQVSTTPSFTVTTVDTWRIHTLVYDPTTLDLGDVVFGSTTAYEVQELLIQGEGDICASLDMSGAGSKTIECEEACTTDAGTISALNPDQCLVDGEAQLEAAPDGNANVPAGYSVIHLLTAAPDLIIASGVEPSFTVTSEGPFGIHTLVYDPATLDLSDIVFGETTMADLDALLLQGGGSICGSLDLDGAAFQVADCNPVCDAYAGTLTAVESEVCLVDGVALLEATPNGDAVLPDGYSIAYILARANGVIENVEPNSDFEWPLLGEYVIHTLVYDPFTINPFEVILGVTTIEEINSVLIQGGGPVCGSLDLVGAAFSVIACEPVCDAFAGTVTAVESEVCRVDGIAHLEATPNGDAVVPSGYSIAYVFARANGIIENVEPNSDFEWPLLGDYVVHALVYDPLTYNPFGVILGVTTIEEINALFIQGGGDICASLDLVGASFSVIDCAPPCDEYAGVGGDRILCFADPVTELFSLLTDSPDEGGSWFGPDGQSFSGSFNPATDPQGIYVYFVTDGPDCPGDTTQLVISLIECPDPCAIDAGQDAAITLCSSDAPVNLLVSLGGDAGGAWTGPGDLPHSGTFIPGLDNPGSYRYIVSAGEECAADTAYVTVVVNLAADAGISAQVSLCDSDAPVVCFGLLDGSPDAGGTWTGPNGAPFDGEFDPAVDEPGIHVYTVEGLAPCADAQATLTILVEDCCDAGEGNEATVCITDAPFAMADLLGGNPCSNGVWTGPDDNPHSGLFNPAIDAAGDYVYTVTGQNGSTSSSTLSISLIECPTDCEADAGTLSVDEPEVCLVDGFATLMAVPNDDAVVPSGFETLFLLSIGSEHVISQMFNAPLFTVDAPGIVTIHTLVYNMDDLEMVQDIVLGSTTIAELNALLIQGGGTICASLDVAGAQFLVSECVDPCAGAAGEDTSVEVCNDGSMVDLFPLLTTNPLPGGSWFWASQSNINPEIVSGLYDSMIGTGGTAGYVVSGGPDCANDTAYVEVIEIDCTDPCAESTPDAGIGGDIIRCSFDPPTELFDMLQGTPDVGGTWTGPDGEPFIGAFDPATDASGTYVYTVFDLLDCDPDTTQLNIQVIDCGEGQTVLTWPNPTVDVLYFESPTPIMGSARIDLIDALGRAFHSPYTVSGRRVTVNVSDLPAGNYSMRVIAGDRPLLARFVRARD